MNIIIDYMAKDLYKNTLPKHENLPIGKLTSVFSSTSASYKFYWFLAILDIVQEDRKTIPFHTIIIRMMALSWYTVNFHKLNFGVQDKLARNIKSIIKASAGAIKEDASKEEIIQYLEQNYTQFKKEINYFNDKVPYHFLTPFIGSHGGVKKKYVAEAQVYYISNQPCPYLIIDKSIQIHPHWKAYLIQHSKILKDFTLWNFLHRFLQSKNPNTPNITEKLIERPVRKSLNEQTKLWKIFAEERPIISIYSQSQIKIFDLDHYVPWSFVAHDQLWNLAPIEKSLNSSKSNRLPDNRLIHNFAVQQYDFFQTIYRQYGINKKRLEDYSNIFHLQTTDIANLPQPQFTEKLRDHLHPLLQFASNQGFQAWEY